MGGAASTGNSILRLRKALAIRAYNVRNSDETLDEQFKKFTIRKPGETRLYITLVDVKRCLGLESDSLWVDELFKRCTNSNQNIGNVYDEMDYTYFIDFLESGKIPPNLQQSPTILTSNSTPSSPSRLPPFQNISQSQKVSRSQNFINNKGLSTTSLKLKAVPPSPPRGLEKLNQFLNPSLPTMYSSVALALNIKFKDINDTALVKSKGLSLSLKSKDIAKHMGPTKPLWRKREVVRQERTVQYTTVDQEGNSQELVEKETTQTEVLHMECRETGEFAHRETTNYEQFETFNDEVVAEQRGTEEYVHLKSLEDEFEYMDSTMPKKDVPEEETQSPRVSGGHRRGSGENMKYPDSPEAAIHNRDGSVAGEDGGSYCEGEESPENTNIRWKNGYPYFKGAMDYEGKEEDDNVVDEEKEHEYGDEDDEANQIDDEEQQAYYQKLRERQAELEKQAYLQKQEKQSYLFEQQSPSPDKQYQNDMFSESPERKYQEDKELEAALNGQMEASNLATEIDEKNLNRNDLNYYEESKENIIDNQPVVWDANDID